MSNKIDLVKIQSMLDWMKTKIYLDSLSEKAKNRIVKRGEVYECNFGIGIGSEMQKLRPCVIIQNNVRNLKSGNVIVAPITHTEKNVPCIATIDTQLNEDGTVLLDGCVNLSLIQTVSKARLTNYITKLSNNDMKKINISICDSTGLMNDINNLTSKIEKKDLYIDELKQTRNKLKDDISSLLKLANVENVEDLKNILVSIINDN